MREEDVLQIKTMGEKINNLFRDAYKKHLILVKRKCPKKLIWTIREKQAFIDTLLRGYPVPLFLFAKTGNGKEREIIDGLQRLDAIFSFIKQEFPVKLEGKWYYCNKDALFCTGEDFEQKYPAMDFDLCMQFGEYELPTITADVTDTINEICKRLNFAGKQYTAQDKRQANFISKFSDLVCTTAANLRGDVTFGYYVSIFEIPKIITYNKRMNYGIDIKDTFWVKYGIMTKAEIRGSKDEETLAQIYSYLLLGKDCNVNSKTLDSFYDTSSDNYFSLENILQEDGTDIWFYSFFDIFEKLQAILDKSGRTFTELLFNKRDNYGKSEMFIALFLAIWELEKEQKVIIDPSDACKVLDGICISDSFKETIWSNDWHKGIRNTAIEFFKKALAAGIIKCEKNNEMQEKENNALKNMSLFGNTH